MHRLLRISLTLCFVVATTAPGLEASHGHGSGGGGHSGGGHMGGGGGHMGGHSGGFSGGHSVHMGGAQHFGGTQHYGGVQHFGGTQHMGTRQLGTQHFGGVQHQGIQSGTIHHQGNLYNGAVQNGVLHQNSIGNQQHLLHNGNQQRLGSTSHQLNAPFYQNHAHHGTTSLGNSTLQHHTNGLGGTLHHQSQFLQNHGARTTHTTNLASLSGTHHQGSQFLHNHGTTATGSHQHGLLNGGNNQSFLGQHHHGGSTVLGSHHTAVGNNQGLHHQNHVGTYVHNNLMQNFNYRHHHNGNFGGNNNNYYRHSNHGWYGNYNRWGGYGFGGFGLGYGLGYGYYPGYYGFGWGLGRFGYGWGLGYNNYSRWGCFSYQPCCYYQPYGYTNYGYGNYGYGYPGYGYGQQSPAYASLSPGLMTYGYGSVYAPPGSATGIITSTDANPTGIQLTDPTAGNVTPGETQLASADPKIPAVAGLPSATEFAQIGETAFKARDYKGAVRAWRHALIDDPNNGVLVMMLSQGLFASEQYNEAAGATQFGMQILAQDKWETVIKNYRELYGKVEDYTNQLRSLEKAAKDKPEDPALRFMLGYHYGFLGYAKEAVSQLEKCVKLAPEDETAQKLLDLFNDKLPKDQQKKEEPPAPAKPPGRTATTTSESGGLLPPLNSAVVPPPPKAPE